MSSNKKKQVRIADTPRGDKAPRSLVPLNNGIFSWCIHSKLICWNSERFGFGSCLACDGFYKDIKTQLDSYSTMFWKDIIKKPHCHPFDLSTPGLDKELVNIFMAQEIETIHQISLSNKHRIFGIKMEDTFYLVCNDPEHLGYPVEKKHT